MDRSFDQRFVGRERELQAFRDMLGDPQGSKRVLFIWGAGGIGKTQLIRQMLADARTIHPDALVIDEPIDARSTDFRYIDGIQSRIIEELDRISSEEIGARYFSPFLKSPSPEEFHACLARLCEKRIVVIAFDTFEHLHEDVTGKWVMDDAENGLQVPGLLSIVAGRLQEPPMPLIDVHKLSGFTEDEAMQLYRNISTEEADISLVESVEALTEITEGHPLKLELAFRSLPPNLWDRKELISLSTEQFEETLILHAPQFGELSFDFAGQSVSAPVYDIIVCMSYLDRRLDQVFLQQLIDEGFVKLDSSSERHVQPSLLPKTLEKYFFVRSAKLTESNQAGELQLHDEMARLVYKYLGQKWTSPRGKTLADLGGRVVQWYDEQIRRFPLTTEDSADVTQVNDVLRIEQLHYLLKIGEPKAGFRLFKDLSDMRRIGLDRFLPGEILEHIGIFKEAADQYEVYSQVAGIEARVHRYQQASLHWEQSLRLAEHLERPEWQVESLIGLHNVTWQHDPQKSINDYLARAKAICESRVSRYLPTVYYEIGFAYRHIEDIRRAISWYEAAEKEWYRQPEPDPLRRAVILNDRGYARALTGDRDQGSEDLRQSLRIRQQHYKHLREQRGIRKQDISDAALQVGRTYNTMGEVARFGGHLRQAIDYYTHALSLFENENDYYWQSQSLFSRCEALRRLAVERRSEGDDLGADADLKSAQDDIQKSLILSERHMIFEGRDTAHRRFGRLLHDQALMCIISGEQSEARNFLDGATNHFERGIRFAKETHDDLEYLEGLTEIAFTVDDLLEIDRNRSDDLKVRIDDLEKAIEVQKQSGSPLFQLPVFGNLLLMERGAYAYVLEMYEEALDFYQASFVGVARDPGYGSARYKAHRDHLWKRIERLQSNMAKHWCDRFIRAWQDTTMEGSEPPQALVQIHPEMVVWCQNHKAARDRKN